MATLVAVASVVAVTAVAMARTEVRCPRCRRMLMAIPGEVRCRVRAYAARERYSGKGRELACPRCRALVEVIEE